MNEIERLREEGMPEEMIAKKLGLATYKQLDDLQSMREASRLYRPTERNPSNLWERNHKPILGTIKGEK